MPGSSSVRDTAFLGDCTVGSGDSNAVGCRVVKTARRRSFSDRFAQVAVAVTVSISFAVASVLRGVDGRRVQWRSVGMV